MQRRMSGNTRRDKSENKMRDVRQHKKVEGTVSGCSLDSGIGTEISDLSLEVRQQDSDLGLDLIVEVEDHSIPVNSCILSKYSATPNKMTRSRIDFC